MTGTPPPGPAPFTYPINPGHEDESWRRFHDEALGRHLAGTYRGEYEDALVAEFEALLPETPPWVHTHQPEEIS